VGGTHRGDKLWGGKTIAKDGGKSARGRVYEVDDGRGGEDLSKQRRQKGYKKRRTYNGE